MEVVTAVLGIGGLALLAYYVHILMKGDNQ